MHRKPAAELYRRYIEDRSLRDLAVATVLFVFVATVLLFLDRQNIINNDAVTMNRQAYAETKFITQQIAGRMGSIGLYLNRTTSMFQAPHATVAGACDRGMLCEKGNSTRLAKAAATIYLNQQLLYRNCFDAFFKPFPFLFDIANQQIVALVPSSNQANATTFSLKASLAATAFSRSQSNWYFLTEGLFVCCRLVESLYWAANCLCAPIEQLILTASTWNYTVWLNHQDQLSAVRGSESTQNYFDRRKDYLLNATLLNTENWMNTTRHCQQYRECTQQFAQSMEGTMSCYLGSEALHRLPVVMVGLPIVLPVLSDNLSAYTLSDSEVQYLSVVVELSDQSYKYLLASIQKGHCEFFDLLEKCLLAFIGAVLLIVFNRIYVKKWFVETLEHLSRENSPPEKLVAELKELIAVVNRFDWFGSLASPYSEEHLLVGLGLFQNESSTYYLPVLEFIYRQLLHVYTQRKDSASQIPIYDELIKLKLAAYQEKQCTLQPQQMDEIFKLEVDKAVVLCRSLRHNQLSADIVRAQNERIIERLNQYAQSFEISQHLLEEASLVEFKTRQALGQPVSYRRLDQLSKSDSNIICSMAFNMKAVELSLRNFDAEAVEYIWRSLTTAPSSNDFKSKRLYFMLRLARKNYWNERQLRELEFMARSFNLSRRRMYIFIDSMEGLEEKMVLGLLERIVTLLATSDVIDIVSLQSENRQGIQLPLSSPNIQEEVRKNVLKVGEQLEGSRRSKSIIEGLVYHFQNLAQPSANYQDYSQYVVVLMSDCILNDVRSEKQSYKLSYCKNLEIVDQYMHLLLIGNHIKNEQFQRSKVIKALREAQTFLQVDLKNYDADSTKEDLQQFFEANIT